MDRKITHLLIHDARGNAKFIREMMRQTLEYLFVAKAGESDGDTWQNYMHQQGLESAMETLDEMVIGNLDKALKQLEPEAVEKI